ncbi:MAG: 2-C-methyl-D-erythritol 2,4-cyclodiphosphate synthase [Elusimicrobiota bacterium]|nr:2-C-methyl-D-erythritol 2,4-cyclodiphosphate synthase [Elusimicrobiota bacterium]
MQKVISEKNFRVGFGYDIHKLVEGRKLILGGVEIKHSRGLLGHSDGDVLIHAICDAILGATGLGDIGMHFPMTDKKYKNISSKIILKKACKIVQVKKYKIANIDCTIVAEEPRIDKYRRQMQNTIAKIVGISADSVNIKATTNEKIGDIGRKKAISAYAVCLIWRKNV